MLFFLYQKNDKIIMEYRDSMIEKKKKNIYNLVILTSILIYILIYRFFVYSNVLKYADAITTSVLMIITSLAIYFYGFKRKVNLKHNKVFISIIAIFATLYFALIYGIGFTSSFLKNAYSLKPLSIINNTFFLILIIILEEILRFVYIKANKKSKANIIVFTLILALLDIIINIRFDVLTDSYELFDVVSTIMLPSILKNIMCTYAVYYADYKGPLLYRFLTELYIFIVPIVPDLNDYINSLGLLLLPFLITITMSRQTDSKVKLEEEKRSFFKLSDIPFAVAAVIIYCLIAGIGPYKLVGIETGSMTPRLNVGDAVIISKNFSVDKLKEGDIIAFKTDEKELIVHRIIKVNSDNTFITKGDYNNVADKGYVKKEQIKGKVVFSIPYIAYPAIMFK